MKKILWVALGMLSTATAFAQDPQLSQYYSAPLYLNPAFTGNLDYECRRLPASRLRTIFNYRNQYRGNFVDYMASIDYRSKNGNWGFGGLFFQDNQESVSTAVTVPLKTFQAAGLVSYKASLTNDWRLHSGVQIGYQNRSLSTNGYIYPDQLSSSGIFQGTNEPFTGSLSKGYVTAAAGLLIYNSDFYLGGAVHHLNQPNWALTTSRGGEVTDRLPMKLDVHTGYRIAFKRQKGFVRRGVDKSVTPVIHYKRQLNTQQLDIGTYLNYEPIVLGAWYRGIPFQKAPDNSLQQDAVVLLAGVRAPTDYGLFKVGLSYDFPVSYGAVNSGRTFELSLAYQFIDERCRKRVSYRHIPCPGI